MPYYLVIDLEATCWEKDEKNPPQHEIIEIGLAVLSAEKKLLANEGWFVKPKLHPELSDFCKKLTSISQDEIDCARSFTEVMPLVEERIEEITKTSIRDCVFVSWGSFDRNQFKRDCELHGYEYPFGTHFNLKREFMKKFRTRMGSMKLAMELVNLTFEGTHHRGIDDALNIANLFRVYIEK